jgi:tetratricopeptide (TPR) repeat protein
MQVFRLQYLFIGLLTFGCLASAQETPSLGDVARKLRTEHRDSGEAVNKASGADNSLSTARTAPSLKVTAGPIRDQTTAAYQDNLRNLFDAGRFDEIDRMAAAARRSKARLRGGYWELHIIYDGLCVPADGNFEAHIARLKRWVNQRPQSITPRVLLANAYNRYAWEARGDAYASQVSEDIMKVFEERVQLANRTLHDSISLEKDAEWYLVAQQLGILDGDLQQESALFAQAIALEPGYQYYYREMAEALLPRWMGEEGDAARFAAQMANQIGGKQGDLIYYHVGSFLWCHCDVNEDYKAFDWQRIKRGYMAQREMYGDSIASLTQIARIAYDGGDFVFADAMFTRLNGDRDEKIWPSKSFYDSAREYSRNFAREHPNEQDTKSGEKEPVSQP